MLRDDRWLTAQRRVHVSTRVYAGQLTGDIPGAADDRVPLRGERVVLTMDEHAPGRGTAPATRGQAGHRFRQGRPGWRLRKYHDGPNLVATTATEEGASRGRADA
jgi:hypothetical protein